MKRATLGTFCGLTCLAMMVLSVSSSYVQVKFYYHRDAEGTGQSWNAYTPKDGSCSPCTNLNMGGEGNPWKSYKLTQDPPDTSIILFDGYSCHGDTSGELKDRSGTIPGALNGIVESFRVCGPAA